MSISLRHLKVFHAVAKEKNFTKAAELMCISQPAVTVTINKLEEMFEARLLFRTTRYVELTDEGEKFFKIAERIIYKFDDGIEEIKYQIKNKKRGVSVASINSMSYGAVLDILPKFRESLPDIPVEIHSHQPDVVVDLVKNGVIDIGIGTLTEADPDIKALPITKDQFGLVMPRNHPLAAKNELHIDWRELRSSPLIWTSSQRNFGSRMAWNDAASVGSAAAGHMRAVVGNPVFTACSDHLALALVNRGFGLAVLPYHDWSICDVSNLVFRPLVGPARFRTIYVMSKSGRHLSAQSIAFRDLIIQHAPSPYEPDQFSSPMEMSA